MKIILLIVLSVSILFGTNFYKIDNHIVDTVNKKMWQDSPENIKVLKNQKNAIAYCENLDLDGYSDWRLPSIKDFEKIIDKNRGYKDPKIIKSFEYALPDHYWLTDKTWRNFFTWAYYVHLISGTFYYDNVTNPKYVKCVRDGY